MARKPSRTMAEPAVQLPRPASNYLDSEPFWQYWETIEKQFPDRVVAYVYRTWPVIDRKKIDPKKEKNIDKTKYLSQVEFRAKWGSGDYKFLLVDPYLAQTKGGNTHRSVCTGVMQIRDPDLPPVLDIEELVMTDADNKHYIEQLRAKGIKLPGDEDTMSNAALETMAKTITDLTQRGVQQQAPPPEHSTTAAAVTAMSQAAAASTDLLTSTFKQASQLRLEVPNPAAQLRETIAAIKELAPPPQQGSSLESAIALLMPIFQSNMDVQRQQIQTLTTILTTTMQKPAAEPVSVRRRDDEDEEDGDLMKTLKAELMKKALEAITNPNQAKGGGGGDYSKVLAMAIPALQSLAGMGMQLMQMHLASKTGVPLPPPPPPPSTVVTNPTSQPQTEEDMIQQMLNQLAGPITTYLHDGHTGADFADWLISGHGRIVYQMVVQNRERLIAEIAKHPELSRLAAQIPDKFGTFVEEFLNRDEIRAKEEQE